MVFLFFLCFILYIHSRKKRNAPPCMSIFLKCMKTIVTKICWCEFSTLLSERKLLSCVVPVQWLCWAIEMCVFAIVTHGSNWVKLSDEFDHFSTVHTHTQWKNTEMESRITMYTMPQLSRWCDAPVWGPCLLFIQIQIQSRDLIEIRTLACSKPRRAHGSLPGHLAFTTQLSCA